MSQLADVNRFIAASRAARSSEELTTIMADITREMGFQAYALMQNVKELTSHHRRFGIGNLRCEWVNYFLKHKLHPHNPVHLASLRTSVGFRFEEMPGLVELTEPRQDVIFQARRIGRITDGFCVPTHVPGEANGMCTFVVCGGTALPEKNLLMAQLVGSFAYEAAREVLFWRDDAKKPAVQCLTTRQLECVLLVGRGKTDWEIAQLLGISEDTVTAHINEARRRYEVSRRSQLPVQALYRGDLAFADIVR